MVFALLSSETNWADLTESSGNSRVFDFELANSVLEDAVYNVAAALYELEEDKWIHPQTKRNLHDFVSRYDFLADQGKFPELLDHC
ncbi:MAG: hypothetical protein GY938_27200 [Ketobacter sp.]|nr:hypothetical protein [Ketobacter sp.]